MARRPEVAELGQGVGVERPGGHGGLAERAQALDHLGGGLVGERHEQDLAGGHDPGGDRIGRPPADHPGLARSGAGQDRHRAVGGKDGLALGVIQPVEDSLRVVARRPWPKRSGR